MAWRIAVFVDTLAAIISALFNGLRKKTLAILHIHITASLLMLMSLALH